MEVIKKWYDQLFTGVSEWSDHVSFNGGPNWDLSTCVYRQQGPGRWAVPSWCLAAKGNDQRQPLSFPKSMKQNGANWVQAWGPQATGGP